MNSILSNLRRSRDRSRTKLSATSSKAKPLDILPGLTEQEEQSEDDVRLSISSAFSASKKAKRDTPLFFGHEGPFMDGFFPEFATHQRPSPAPRPRKAAPAPLNLGSPLDNIDFRFSGLELPFPAVPSSPTSLRARSTSPTPSIASVASASTVSSVASSSSPHAKIITPPTSDDESQGSRLVRTSTIKSHRGTIGYVPGARKQRSASEKSVVDINVENADDDAAWFAQDISDSFGFSAEPEFVAPAPPMPSKGRSRFSKPLPIVPRLSIQSVRSPRLSPSTQLDPTFPSKRRSYIPSRPPPPPPIRIIDVDCDTDVYIAPPTPETPTAKPSPTMEEKTEELLALLATAALSTTTALAAPRGPSRLSCISSFAPMSATGSSYDFVIATPTALAHGDSEPTTPETPRPPPRSSVPADIADMFAEDESNDVHATASNKLVSIASNDFDLGELELEWTPDSDDESPPATPRSMESASLYSQSSLPYPSNLDLDSIPLEPCTPAVSVFFEYEDDMHYGVAIPDSPLIRGSDDLFDGPAPERVLRSRWSSSTLAESLAEGRGSRWMGRFTFGTSSKKSSHSPTRSSFHLRSPTMPSFNIPLKKPASPPKPAKPSRFAAPRGLVRRMSNASLASDSGDSVMSASSTTSNGLRRKPIPIEIFMRS